MAIHSECGGEQRREELTGTGRGCSKLALGHAGLLVVMLLAGCASTPFGIDNTEWELVRWNGQSLPHGDSAKALSLRIEQRQILGYSGCNFYSGPYQVKHARFSSGPLRTTHARCETPSVEGLEEAFLTALTGGGHLAIDDEADRLIIEPGAGEVLEFRQRL